MKVDYVELEVDEGDDQVIASMYKQTKRERGWYGPVFVNSKILYGIHGKTARDITRAWLKIIAHDSKQI